MTSNLENIIGYHLKNKGLLKGALTHPSVAPKKQKDFERLEFLGDRVLGLIVAQWVYKIFPNEKEGDLAKRLGALVRKEACEWVAEKIQLQVFFKSSIPQGYSSAIADAVEALVGALFLDGGLEVATQFVHRFWEPLLKQNKAPPKDFKSTLQEWAQGLGKPVPTYELLKQEGLAHAPVFKVQVNVEGYPKALGEGPTKRVAEQKAAENMLIQIKNI